MLSPQTECKARGTTPEFCRPKTYTMTLRSQLLETGKPKRKLDPGGVEDPTSRGKMKRGRGSLIADLCFKQILVSFLFGPPELNRLSFVIKRLQHLMTSIKSELPVCVDFANRILLCHHPFQQTKDVCLLLFDSIPSEELVDADGSEVKDIVVVCYIEDNLVKDRGSKVFMQHLHASTSKENFFLVHNLSGKMTMENILEDWEIQVDSNHLIPHNSKKSRIFKRMYNTLDVIVHSVKAALKQLPEGTDRENAMKKLACIERKIKESPFSTGLSNECRELLQSGQNFGVIAYRTDSECLTVYTNQPETRTLNAKLKELSDKCSPLTFRHFRVQTPIFRKHHLTAGSKLENIKSDLLGTLGAFAMKVKENVEMGVAITSAHVIWKGCSAKCEINGRDVEIGTCTWPPESSDEHMEGRIMDMALVELNPEVREKISTSRNVCLYVDRKEDLDCQPVYKYGWKTGKSNGEIEIPQFNMYGNNVMIITCANEEKFSEPGDSGALVLTKKGDNLIGLGIIFGDDLNIRDSDDEFPENASVAIYMDEAIQRFEKASGNEKIRLDRYTI